MSDTSQGPGWWLASDGKWYPPAPESPPPPPPGPPVTATSAVGEPPSVDPPGGDEKPFWRRWWVIAIAAVVVIGGIVAVVGGDDEEEGAEVDTEQPVDDEVEEVDDEGEEVDDEVSDDDAGEDESGSGEDAEVEEEDEKADDAPVGTRDNPVPLGEPITIDLDGILSTASSWTILVDGPGSDVTDAVLAENQFNDPPEPGSLFFGVPVTVTLESAEEEPLSMLFNVDLKFFGPSSLSIIGSSFDENCGVTPNEIDTFKEIFAGGSLSGTVCFQISEEDADEGVLLTTDSGDGPSVFLATR